MSRLVQMRWPDGLVERVDAVAGPRGRSAFVVRVLEEALGGSRVGASGQDTGLPKGPEVAADVPAPSPRASVAKSFGVPDVRPAPVEFEFHGKRPGGFVPRPKKGGGS